MSLRTSLNKTMRLQTTVKACLTVHEMQWILQHVPHRRPVTQRWKRSSTAIRSRH